MLSLHGSCYQLSILQNHLTSEIHHGTHMTFAKPWGLGGSVLVAEIQLQIPCFLVNSACSKRLKLTSSLHSFSFFPWYHHSLLVPPFFATLFFPSSKQITRPPRRATGRISAVPFPGHRTAGTVVQPGGRWLSWAAWMAIMIEDSRGYLSCC